MGQVIFQGIANKVVFNMKSGECRQIIIIMQTQFEFYFQDPSGFIIENGLWKGKRTYIVAQARNENYQTE